MGCEGIMVLPGQHPCLSGAGGKPCQRFRLGSAYNTAQCRLCWLFAHDPDYNRSWGGVGMVTPQRQVVYGTIMAGKQLSGTWQFQYVTFEQVAKDTTRWLCAGAPWSQRLQLIRSQAVGWILQVDERSYLSVRVSEDPLCIEFSHVDLSAFGGTSNASVVICD